MVIPLFIKRTVATGISKATPKAKTSFNTKLRYWLMSVITWMVSGDILIKNLKIIGHTTKKANAAPQKNKTTVESIKGAVSFFSFSYRPGDVNIQIWKNNHGIEKSIARYKTSLIGAINGEATSVAIIVVPIGRISINGAATKE